MPGHRRVTAEDVTDGALVAGQLRALKTEVHSGFELLTSKLMTGIEKLGQKLDDLGDRVGQLEREQGAIDRRVAALEAHMSKRRKAREKSP